MADRFGARLTIARRVQLEAGSWGALIALNTALVSLLLISRGAGAPELAVYASGASLFGLGAGVVGPWTASRVGGADRVILTAIWAGRAALAVVPLLLLTTENGGIPPLIAALLLWSVGEGIAQPLWIARLAGMNDPSSRSGWLSARATSAAVGAACAMLPLLLLARLLPTEAALIAAYAGAVVAGVVSAGQVGALLRVRVTPTLVRSASRPIARGSHAGPGLWFLGGLFAFWFGAALNRPILPPYVVIELGAPAAYFATAAVVAAMAGAGLQPRWGKLGGARGARTLLGWSGLVAGIAPLLWTVVPDYRFGIPVEVLASSCWLGHLLGLNLHAVETAEDDAQRSSVIARMQLAQGSAAAIAPVAAAAVVGTVGTSPILLTSGVVCLVATAVMIDVARPPARLPMALGETVTRFRSITTPPWAAWSRTIPEAYEPAPQAALNARSLAWPNRSWTGQRRKRLPLPLVQALSAACPTCQGIGCRACHGIGLN